MSIDHFISRGWRLISMIAFGIGILFIYRGLPDLTAVHFGETGRGDGFLPKDQIFYLTTGIVTLFNVLALLLIKSIEKIPQSFFAKGLAVFAEKGDLEIKTYVIHWLHFLPAIVNTYLIFVFRGLLLLNDQRTFDADYTYIAKLGIVLILVWVMYLPVRLMSLPNKK